MFDDAHFEEVQPSFEVSDLVGEFVGDQRGGVCFGLEEGHYEGGVTNRGP